ncbi:MULTISPECIES: thymidine kinase [Spiroplasma]|uniref:Thymidine kinase n=2 Tax=Spiroplasma ixodetis TaxID=2141 RepID=A0ABN6SW07_9MOLU|nr:thymidine kinase [Spiroplasma ixodetis]WDA53735.1 MAG: thymidine kinase [Spiroplasma endosymbiont of Drosophila atripex]WJG69383.1 thymidine kinase [Spiroplasma ixodetis Y32]BDT03049.1 thymidine kinase [Spiroplasma ixodetis]
MYSRYNEGWIEVITGCMFAGKTEEFMRRINRLQYAKRKVLVFKPKVDIRYDAKKVVSHKGVSITAIVIDDPMQILKHVDKEIEAVAIDEVQFFKPSIIEVIKTLANQNKQVIVAGLDQDFRGEPFPVTKELLALAEFVTKLDAVCVKCGKAATRTQRIINGREARYDDEIILIGAQEQYEARCRSHHRVLTNNQNR